MTEILINCGFDSISLFLLLGAAIHPCRLWPIAVAMDVAIGAFFAQWRFQVALAMSHTTGPAPWINCRHFRKSSDDSLMADDW
jgi:hypothetical protein